jgi:hypothetical protein
VGLQRRLREAVPREVWPLPRVQRSARLWIGCALLLRGVAACEPEAVQREMCRIMQKPTELPAELYETSGIAMSRRLPGVVWSHNDSGDEPSLVAVTPTGKLISAVRITGAEQTDWEDLARAPCERGDCLYIADIGDNKAERASVELYRLPEPTPGKQSSVAAERFSIRYPDGPRDAEAMFVLPSGDVFVISKGGDVPAALYRYPPPLRAEELVELELVRPMSAGVLPRNSQITGADASPDGSWIAVRTYGALYLYRTAELLARDVDPSPLRVDVTPLAEPQGEAIGLGNDGTVVLTSEGAKNETPATISQLLCTLP